MHKVRRGASLTRARPGWVCVASVYVCGCVGRVRLRVCFVGMSASSSTTGTSSNTAKYTDLRQVSAVLALPAVAAGGQSGVSSDAGGGTESPSSSELSSAASDDVAGADFVDSVLQLVAYQPEPALRPMSPRITRVLEGLGVDPIDSVRSCQDAMEMVDGTFGELTDAIQDAAYSYIKEERAVPPSSVGVTSRSSGGITACLAGGGGSSQATTVRPSGTSTAIVSVSNAAMVVGSGDVPPPSGVSLWVAGSGGHVPSVVSSGAGAMAVLSSEDRATAEAAEQLLRITPAAFMFHTPSAAPFAERVANRRRHISSQGVGSIRKGIAAMKAWLEFCSRHALPNFGMPADEDTLGWFLREEDASARARASRGRSNSSVESSIAGGLRWLHDHCGLPFDAAKVAFIRKSAAPPRDVEPAWSQMWEVAIVLHLMRIAVLYRGENERFIRPNAAGGFFLTVGSVRKIDGLRSAPPEFDPGQSQHSIGRFRLTAALSKGRRKSQMQPLPWVVPVVSPDPSISDEDLLRGLTESFGCLPSGACSIFMQMLDSGGRNCGLRRAVSWGTDRSSPGCLKSTISYLLQFAPLSLSREEADRVAARQHGPRHIVPELGRVAMLPVPARDELGYWKDRRNSKGRIGQNSNRYSRDGEQVLQDGLRSFLLRRVRDRVTDPCARYRLEEFAAEPTDGSAMQFGQSLLETASSL